MKKTLNKFVKLLNDLEKEFIVKYWAGDIGVDIIIKNTEYNDLDKSILNEWNLIISINEEGYTSFEYDIITSKDKDD